MRRVVLPATKTRNNKHDHILAMPFPHAGRHRWRLPPPRILNPPTTTTTIVMSCCLALEGWRVPAWPSLCTHTTAPASSRSKARNPSTIQAPQAHTHDPPPTHNHPLHHSIVMAFVRTAARQMGHGLERVDVNLSMRKWWKLGYTRQNGLVRSNLHSMQGYVGWGRERKAGRTVALSLSSRS